MKFGQRSSQGLTQAPRIAAFARFTTTQTCHPSLRPTVACSQHTTGRLPCNPINPITPHLRALVLQHRWHAIGPLRQRVVPVQGGREATKGEAAHRQPRTQRQGSKGSAAVLLKGMQRKGWWFAGGQAAARSGAAAMLARSSSLPQSWAATDRCPPPGSQVVVGLTDAAHAGCGALPLVVAAQQRGRSANHFELGCHRAEPAV